jgi:hypothetical protein
MHTYCSQFEPTFEFSRCKQPVCHVEVKQGNIVATWCAEGHFIRGRIFTDGRAEIVAARLQRWIELANKTAPV